jgi:hypothetical protein
MRNHQTVLASRNLVGAFALFVAGGCQVLFGVDLPDPASAGA